MRGRETQAADIQDASHGVALARVADFPLKYRRLRAILKTFNVKEDVTKRGKGSERMFVGVVDGKVIRLPTKCHNEGDEKPRAVIRSIRRHFKLTEADGVSDEEFYGRA